MKDTPLPLIVLAMTQREDPPRRFCELCGDGPANPDRRAMAERPRVRLDPRNFPVRVAIQNRQWLNEGFQHTGRKEPAHGQRRIEGRGAMAFAENETVAQGGLGLCRVELQHGEEQRCQDAGDREIAANVTEASAADHLDHASADVGRPIAP